MHLAVAVNTLALGVVVALIAEVQDALELPNSALGVIAGAGALSAFVSYLVLAPYADHGYSRAMLVVGSLVSATAMMAFAYSSGLRAVVTAKVLLGLAGGMFVPAARSVALEWRHANPGETLGRLTAATVGGFAIGPVVGSTLASNFGLTVPFAVVGLLLLILAPLLYGLAKTSKRSSAIQVRTLSLLANRLVLAGIVLGTVDFTTVAVSDALWARILTDQGATVVFLGASYSLALGSTIFFAPRFGRMADRTSAMRVGRLGLIFVVLAMLVYGFADRPVFLGVGALSHAVGCAALAPVAAALVVQGSQGAIGRGQGLLRASAYLAAGIVALPSGWAYDRLGRPAWFLGLAILAVALASLASWLVAGSAPPGSVENELGMRPKS